MLAAMPCDLDLDVCHFDIEQVFVQSDLEEDVNVGLLPDCGRLSGIIVRLKKSVYGMTQVSRQ